MGLLAKDPAGSLAPDVMNAFFRDKAPDYHYQSFAVDPPQFRDAFQGLLVLSGIGFHVGPPFRGTVVRMLSRLSKEVQFVGAADTVGMRNGPDTGYNTQFLAISRYISEAGMPVQSNRAMIIGAGAAASAALYALLSAGAKGVFIANKTPQRAEALAARYRPYFDAELVPVFLSEAETRDALADCKLVIHATPLGSLVLPQIYPKMAYSGIRPDAHVLDLVYRPQHTPFLARASRFTNKLHSGLRVFGLALAESWKIWSGQDRTGLIWKKVEELV